MATTSPDGLYSPDEDTPVDFVADWASSMSSVQTAISNRASKAGTTAQRTAATGVREGTLWYDTDTQSLWRFESGTWTSTSPGISYVDSASGVFSPASGISVVSFVAAKVGGIVSVTLNLNGSFSGANTTVGTISGGFASRTAAVGTARFTNSGYLNGTASISGASGGTSTITAWKETTAARGSVLITASYPGYPS